MRVDMRLDRFYFQFLYQRLEPQCIQLLTAAFRHIVINEVDQIPDDNVDEEIESVVKDIQQRTVDEFFLQIVQQTKPLGDLHIQSRYHKRKDEGDHKKVGDLLLYGFLQCIQCNDDRTHQVSEDDPKQHKNTQAGKYHFPRLGRAHFLK